MQKRSPHDCHALYTNARHVHEHDVGHEHGHDAEGWESCTYGDIGVAGLAVFEQDLVNLWKRKSMKSFVNLGPNYLHLLAALVHMLLVVQIPHLA